MFQIESEAGNLGVIVPTSLHISEGRYESFFWIDQGHRHHRVNKLDISIVVSATLNGKLAAKA
jgi:hypothetical protein